MSEYYRLAFADQHFGVVVEKEVSQHHLDIQVYCFDQTGKQALTPAETALFWDSLRFLYPSSDSADRASVDTDLRLMQMNHLVDLGVAKKELFPSWAIPDPFAEAPSTLKKKFFNIEASQTVNRFAQTTRGLGQPRGRDGRFVKPKTLSQLAKEVSPKISSFSRRDVNRILPKLSAMELFDNQVYLDITSQSLDLKTAKLEKKIVILSMDNEPYDVDEHVLGTFIRVLQNHGATVGLSLRGPSASGYAGY